MPSLFVSNELRTAQTNEQGLIKCHVITAVYNYDC